MTFAQMANTFANELHRNDTQDGIVLGITGPSCVGKTTLCEALAMAMRVNGCSTQVISADNFLKKEYRGQRKFRQNVNEHLALVHFDYQGLLMVLQTLMSGRSYRMDMYVRGSGWQSNQVLHAASVLLVDGLFLDGLGTREARLFTLRLNLQSSEKNIAEWRRSRDERYRKANKDDFRGREETEREIERTLLAYRCYKRFDGLGDVRVLLDRDHRVIQLSAFGASTDAVDSSR